MKFADALHIAYPLDRFAQGSADIVGQEPEEFATCEGCRTSIYTGEEYLELGDGAIVHDDMDCLKRYTGAVAREAV